MMPKWAPHAPHVPRGVTVNQGYLVEMSGNCLKCGILLPGCQPMVRQQLIDPLGRVTHDPPQDVCQVLLGVDVQIPAGLNRR